MPFWYPSGTAAFSSSLARFLDAIDDEEDRALVMEREPATITELEKALKIKLVADALLIRFVRDRAGVGLDDNRRKLARCHRLKALGDRDGFVDGRLGVHSHIHAVDIHVNHTDGRLARST